MAEHVWKLKSDGTYIYCINCFMRKHWPGAVDSCSVPKGLSRSALGSNARKKVRESEEGGKK